ncbi:hypothetical protein PR202_gb10284 [Eleusine coracana subsp. coracana]|uniref:poly(ADP-ribose) glycohydrolase n=1 Tax=Eleusine coracana subsp. coracana TaxID=191504 RepID=A0AAV5EK93_ELECO|nr:hypothetical protein PR202_gb10284 [Eleusine coracana subsp. coracana]
MQFEALPVHQSKQSSSGIKLVIARGLDSTRVQKSRPRGPTNPPPGAFALAVATATMEESTSTGSGLAARGDLRSALPFLPVVLRGDSLFWPPAAQESLRALALGPDVSRVVSGDVLADALTDLRQALDLPPLSAHAAEGFAIFFNDLLSRVHAQGWFAEVFPSLARLLLRLPALLEDHYAKAADGESGLRILGSQDAGVVLLSQELAAALLACALFCLFPTADRGEASLPRINFDGLFSALTHKPRQSQEQKVRAQSYIIQTLHISKYFCSVPQDDTDYKELLLATFQAPCDVFSSGFIEDEEQEALEVDFANKRLGGGALFRGCVQEEIRFMINPELIVGMLFMASMEDNEAIEIIGAERYGSTFRFVGDYLDTRPFDSLRRRRTRILAIDALARPSLSQYESSGLLREANKAFCGFMDPSKQQFYVKLFQNQDSNNKDNCSSTSSSEYIGVSTGNWGCGAFGGDPEIKSMVQWIAASQALRPFVNYYTFEAASLEKLEEVIQWVLHHGWTVGELWHMLLEYSSQRLRKETHVGFFGWLLPNDSRCCDIL